MDFWAWFWIWTVLIVLGLGYLGFLAYDLMVKLGPISKQLETLLARVQKLNEAIEQPAFFERPADNLLDDPATLLAERAEAQKRKREKRSARERRLIESLDAIDVNERRFTDAP